MTIPINTERLAQTFVQLCETDSPSRREREMSQLLQQLFAELEPEAMWEDDSAGSTGSNCGNLLVRFAGPADAEPIFLNCHMDTVEPGSGVQVRREGDIFYSAGETILGSDDKAGIAAILEALRVLREQGWAAVPLECVFTTCEEIGLLGAKALDSKSIRAKNGYALDTSGRGRVITGAPAANRLRITVNGIAAHAGLHPERGVNAIVLAAQALQLAPCGRIDEETTANFGTIHGGMASNIVAESVTLEVEVRSHNRRKLAQVTLAIEAAFTGVVEGWRDPDGLVKGRPSLEFTVHEDFPEMSLAPDSPVVQRIARAARTTGMELCFERAGGGSDANIFNGFGLATAIVATGMTHVHSTKEQVSLQDMTDLARLLVSLLRAETAS